MRRSLSALLALYCVVAVGCHRPKHYEANVEVTRLSPVRKDPKSGTTLTADLEISFVECPGTQVEVMRGNAAFAACTAKFKVGDKVKVDVEHVWVDEGHWTSVVRRVGDCPREVDPNDEASFALVRECEDWSVNGTRVGFTCSYVPEKKLLEKCPWFRRH